MTAIYKIRHKPTQLFYQYESRLNMGKISNLSLSNGKVFTSLVQAKKTTLILQSLTRFKISNIQKEKLKLRTFTLKSNAKQLYINIDTEACSFEIVEFKLSEVGII